MIIHMTQAFEAYKAVIKKRIEEEMKKNPTKPCERCQENINRMHQHAEFYPSKPHVLAVACDSAFELDYTHLTRLSSHVGMPVDTSHDYCEQCHTNFYYSFEGFDSDQEFCYGTGKLQTVKDYLRLFSREKKVLTQQFAPFLNNFFQESEEEVALFVSLDEHLRRSNHTYLESYYAEKGYDLAKLDHVFAYLNEEELFTQNRCGGLYKKEYLQKVQYPLRKIQFLYEDYYEKVKTEIDIKWVQNPLFFDVYEKDFLAFEQLDPVHVHPIKRNEDTYTFFSETRKKFRTNEQIYYIDTLFTTYFAELTAELLTHVLPKEYEMYEKKKRKEEKDSKELKKNLHKFTQKLRDQQKKNLPTPPTSLQSIKPYDNICVESGIYRSMRGCVKEIDFEKETLGIVFFGEENLENVIHIKANYCTKEKP